VPIAAHARVSLERKSKNDCRVGAVCGKRARFTVAKVQLAVGHVKKTVSGDSPLDGAFVIRVAHFQYFDTLDPSPLRVETNPQHAFWLRSYLHRDQAVAHS
jgi:hypothetical protein